MARSYNFSAGPAALPLEVLQEAHEEFFDFAGTGMSIMEISHRSGVFIDIARQAELDLRALLQVPDRYKVLFLQGGASLQFSQVPMNLLRGKASADYLHTGLWSGKAIEAARRYCTVRIAASSESTGFDRIPAPAEWRLDPGAAYLHYTENETVHGVQFATAPEAQVPLVCDACSSLLSKPIDVSRHGLIYAAAQKNMGPAGVTVVVVDEALLDGAMSVTPDVLNYAHAARADSMFNTPATFSWYLTGLTLRWIRRNGGINRIHQANQAKAWLLYRAIDASGGFYANAVRPEFRSINNVPFFLADSTLEPLFLRQAESAGLMGLKGHTHTGGIRASLYNAVDLPAAAALADFMTHFQRAHG
ncbi:3-phosphoserine/phosphohydroxythreonine transaminase [Achromobacter insolitus]|jgi:phosphoserine aminotransferase|uniref:Phosphoserine aminotransferase n=1 Tax=Achromobacter insolitus TaxID=217204 RepID=A0A6S7FDD8_9BURK|nr:MULTISPECIES: 3-phosphoserine/phosphohydroxythreonine transaminase [Achromobacter]GLK95894.1 phosphoserine aminotransferase [Achromobacter xylosoxidans]AXA74463.1 phosphoserine transaminase [Achromobacter insolitus]MCP1401093.1 phosphoserine aminotransferase [Achromobacter insolitus]MDH3062422.1 3-phosphoserine/phosphohydroxythreonine transaminase [Achromobacter insolitus]MEB3095503.1 3-phosphoserine/phosphohydroxythreonine transaminase [Achromobacter sp. D10]